jgi:hypothetical protein
MNPIIWKLTYENHKPRFFLVYEGAFIVTNGGKAFAQPVAIEFNRDNEGDNAPPEVMNHVYATHGKLAFGAIEIKEGQIEPLPVSQFGFTRRNAISAMEEAEYFSTKVMIEYPNGKAIYSPSETKKKIIAAHKMKNGSHLWKLTAWMNWDSWNKKEMTYKERVQALTEMGFSLTDSALKSASQIKGLAYVSARKK